jgi:spore coat protein U-like protein
MSIIYNAPVKSGGKIHVTGNAATSFTWKLHKGSENGSVVKSGNGTSGNFDLNLGVLSDGTYTLVSDTDDGDKTVPIVITVPVPPL